MTTSSKRPRHTDADDWAHHLKLVAAAKLDPARALKNLKGRLALRRANLLDPNWEGPGRGPSQRRIPEFAPGMTTARYIEVFQAINHHTKLEFIHRDGMAALFDDTQPEVTHEVLVEPQA